MRQLLLEHAIGTVLRTGTMISGAALALGLALSFVPAARDVSYPLLMMGIVVLLLTPVGRVFVSFIDFVLRRDWLFVALTSIVLCLLASAFVAAFMS
jgi:uncharacterized membrane protein